jgi:hypothetical protein
MPGTQVDMRRDPHPADLIKHEAMTLEPRSGGRQARECRKTLRRASGRVLIGHHGLAFSMARWSRKNRSFYELAILFLPASIPSIKVLTARGEID